MNEFVIDGYKFLRNSKDSVEFVFSTAENGLNFNKSLEQGLENLENIKRWFGVEDVGYLNQMHSDKIFIYEGKIEDGDAFITARKNIAIGVFTADCVPVLIYDNKNNAVAAVHSGWKGTLDCIVKKAIEEMSLMYGTRGLDIEAYIGPHNNACCYEVGEEVIEKFKTSIFYKDKEVSKGRYLDMGSCIEYQLKESGVLSSNINNLNMCTFCKEEYKMHSYRKDKEEAGRMFSFVFLK